MVLVRPLRFEHPPHLPPPSSAPILEHYDPEIRRVSDDARCMAPVDNRGVVDIFATVDLALTLVDPDYSWPRDHHDIHHFVWERAAYRQDQWDGDRVPRDYREISFHKGYLPRQFHDFIHATIAPPPVPDYDIMESRLRSYESAKQLFLAARRAVIFDRRPERFKGVTPEILLEEEIIQDISERMNGEVSLRQAGIGDYNEFSDVEALRRMSPRQIARTLGRVAARDAVNLLPEVYGRRKRFKMAA